MKLPPRPLPPPCKTLTSSSTYWSQLRLRDQALEQSRQALSVAQVLSHPFSLAEVLRAVAFVHLVRREGQEAHAQADTLLTLALEHGLADWLGIGPSLQGGALVQRTGLSDVREQRDAGLVRLGEGLAADRALGAEIYVPLFLGALAQGYAQGGQAEEGLEAIAEALAMMEKNEERWTEADLYRLKGELTLHSLDHDSLWAAQQKAEACFHKALAIARQQHAKSWELRAATSLARLWQGQGKRAEARELMAPVYWWFTEGFDTADLKDAKALLQELT